MMKKGAIHVDWVISMSIFLVYLLVLLVLIKPSYKPTYEGDVLTNIVKDKFLEENRVDAGFVIGTKKGDCSNPSSVKGQFAGELGISKDDIFVKYFAGNNYYKAYFLDGGNLGGDDYEDCVDVGEVVYYNGLKEKLKEPKDFDFPRKYKIIIYEVKDDGSLKEDGENGPFGSDEKPSSDDEVYVLDWSASKLKWSGEEIVRENIIINIRVW